MKAIVLAAGRGKRLASITTEIPKVLATIGEKTLIEHNIDKLRKIGIQDIALVIGYKAEMIAKLLGNSVEYFKQDQQLGTAHAFLSAEKFIDEQYFLGMNGDIFFTEPLDNFIKLKPPAIAVYWAENPSRYGRVKIENEKLISIEEKSDELRPGYVNAGMYMFSHQIFEWIKKTLLSPRKEYEITDTIQMLIETGETFSVHKLTGFWTDIAFAADLKKARDMIGSS